MNWILATAAFGTQITAVMLLGLFVGAALVLTGLVFFSCWCQHKENIERIKRNEKS